MASKGQHTGMRGVFLVAAELAARDFVVSTTSRNAMGADLLVADESCSCAYSVQVKTNAKPAGFWLVGTKAQTIRARTHLYAFVNIRADSKHEYYIVPSDVVASNVRIDARERSTWYAFYKRDAESYRDAWHLFGRAFVPQPNVAPEPGAQTS